MQRSFNRISMSTLPGKADLRAFFVRSKSGQRIAAWPVMWRKLVAKTQRRRGIFATS